MEDTPIWIASLIRWGLDHTVLLGVVCVAAYAHAIYDGIRKSREYCGEAH